MSHQRDTRQAARLLTTAARLTAGAAPEIDRLGRLLLALPGCQDRPDRAQSVLNNDGMPLQWCLSARTGQWDSRLIGDPAVHLMDPWERLEAARRALHTALAETETLALEPLCERTLALTLPAEAAELAAFVCGTVWIAVGLERPGIACYVDAQPLGAEQGWTTARTWLTAVLPDPAVAMQTIEALERFAVAASFGIEGATADTARAKLYFRLRQPVPIADWGVPLFQQPDIDRFLALALADRTIQQEGLVISVGFQVGTGDLIDGKIDLCGHCLPMPTDAWVALVNRCTDAFEVARLPIAEALGAGGCDVAFLGLGIDRDRSPRINCYLKTAPPQGMPTRAEIHAAIVDGIDYLRRLQHADGRWVDYCLPVGVSEDWVTAYAGLALAETAAHGGGAEAAQEAAASAADWLETTRRYPQGWGFNGATGPDADSTAFAVALLQRLGRPVLPADRAFLCRHWQPQGGIATYSGPDAWGDAHPDVTPLAFLGLPPEEQQDLRPALLAYLRSTRGADGLWPAYWWRQPFYSTYMVLSCLHTLGLDEQWLPAPTAATEYQVRNAFDLACLIGIEYRRGGSQAHLSTLLRTLLSLQQPDGAWPGAANLRVTDPHCRAPWEDSSGEYYTDTAHILTTATVLRVLSETMSAF